MKRSLLALKYFFPPDFAASLSDQSFLYRLLHEQGSAADNQRQYINNSLELALRHDLADTDLKGRLRKGDQEVFDSAIKELRCAKFLEGLFGVNSLRWHPQGREGRIGEFEIVLSNLDKPIFVEVKTIFPRDLESLEERIIDKLLRYAEQVSLPFDLSVHIKEVGKAEDFSGKKFKKFLEEELGKINVGETKEELLKLPDYRDDKTGLHLEIEVFPVSPEPIQGGCHIGIIGGEARSVRNEAYIHHSLHKAYEQRPEGKQPFLVILCSSTTFPIDEHDMLNVLLGPVSYWVSDRPGTKPEPFRKLDGFPRPQRNRQLSAIGLYGEKFTKKGIESSLEIYHNPWARNPLDYSIFEGHGVRQLVKIDDEHMGWKD